MPFQSGRREPLGGPGESLQSPATVNESELALAGPGATEVGAHVHARLKGRLTDDGGTVTLGTQSKCVVDTV